MSDVAQTTDQDISALAAGEQVIAKIPFDAVAVLVSDQPVGEQ